jgi:predicted CoA-substrate-specific enzyme activase
MSVYLGCDIGTVSLKGAAVVVDPSLAKYIRGRNVLAELEVSGKLNGPFRDFYFFLSPYHYIKGNPVEAAKHLIMEIASFFPKESITSVALTGSGAKLAAELFGLNHYSDFKTIATGVSLLHPDVESVLEMGGENSKFLKLQKDPGSMSVGIVDYDTNGDCAAGTGSFLDQQSSRLCYKVEEIGEIVAEADQGAKIAGRCSVFAKSDMIHAQQKGATPPQILKGLCEAVARNFKGNVANGRELEGRTAFVGGVANNNGVFDAVRQVFGAKNGNLFVPESPAFYGALGTALLEKIAGGNNRETAVSNWSQTTVEKVFPSWPVLNLDKVKFLSEETSPERPSRALSDSEEPVQTYLGLDIGSVSTNLVLIDKNSEVIHESYLRTQGRPVEVVNQGLKEIERLYGKRIKIRGVGTTGSGRELVGELVGADTVNDEITAHKTGAALVAQKYLSRPVDSIFEIGGQDSKFISLNDGIVVDFTMNEACAAGTGSFLEEQAEKLDVSIIHDFADRALQSKSPIRLGERCTVYMEMDVTSFLRNGAKQDDVIAGLAYSIVQNYLNRVVRGRNIGDVVFFQGGTAYNHAVAAAFSLILDKEIIVPPHNGVMGAYGVALMARDKMHNASTQSHFRGFDIDAVYYSIREFTCKDCPNHCDIQEFNVEGKKTYWGDKCSDRFRKRAKIEKNPVIDDLFALRQQELEKNWLLDFANGEHDPNLKRMADKALAWCQIKEEHPRYGMLRAMYYYHRHPFWRTYLEAMGGTVEVTDPTNKSIANAGIEDTVAEPCFPIQAAHGHLRELAGMEIDHAIIPAHINDETDDQSVQSHVCPFGQALPFLLKHSPAVNGLAEKLLMPLVHFRHGEKFVEGQLWNQFGSQHVGRRHHRLAVSLGFAAQKAFQKTLITTGQRALATLKETGESGIILVGRPYNIYDPGLNLNLAAKLRQQYGANVIPLDFIPSASEDLNGLNWNMYWNYGRKILRTALWSSKQPHMHMIYLTNFMCGPDSFIKTFAAEGAAKPFLTLQFDGHSNDAGMMTRCEAYLDSKGLLRCE